MSDTPKVILNYAGDDRFLGVTPTGHAHVLDFGDQNKAAGTPMEYLLLAVGGCTGADVVSILRKKRQTVTGYRIEVAGDRRDEYPRSYKKIAVKHIVTGRRLDPEAVRRAVQLSDEKYCSVAATVRPTAEIVTTIEVIEDPAFADQEPSAMSSASVRP